MLGHRGRRAASPILGPRGPGASQPLNLLADRVRRGIDCRRDGSGEVGSCPERGALDAEACPARGRARSPPRRRRSGSTPRAAQPGSRPCSRRCAEASPARRPSARSRRALPRRRRPRGRAARRRRPRGLRPAPAGRGRPVDGPPRGPPRRRPGDRSRRRSRRPGSPSGPPDRQIEEVGRARDAGIVVADRLLADALQHLVGQAVVALDDGSQVLLDRELVL